MKESKNLGTSQCRWLCVMLLLALTFIFSFDALADTCPRCKGSRWQTTIPEVGHYGVERSKQKCPVCGKMVFSGHQDPCTVCGGTGNLPGHVKYDENRASERAADAGRDLLMSNLTVDEYEQLNALLATLFLTKTVYDTCNVCHGSKVCPQCGGYQNFSIDADITTLCRLCGGGGLCVRCQGQGILSERTELLLSDAEREQVSKNCGVINSLALLRNQRGIPRDQPGGPHIEVDEYGNYFIQEGSSGGSSSSDGSGNSGNYDNGNGFSSSYSSPRSSNLPLQIAFILGCAILFAGVGYKIRKWKKRRNRKNRNKEGGNLDNEVV